MTNPQLITTPFAENGTKNIIPESGSAEPQLATMQAGFPEITQRPISDGGIPPERADFNGILNLYGQHLVHLNKGLAYEFDQGFADSIGGYPLNSRVMLTNGDVVQNTQEGNTNNPNSNMGGWKSSAVSKDVTVPTYKTAADGVNPVNGVADGAYFNVHSDDNDTVAIEYQNIDGSAVATGKSYPSSNAKWDASLVVDGDKNQHEVNQEQAILNNKFKNRVAYFEDVVSDVTGTTDVTAEMQSLLDSYDGDIYAKPTSIFRTSNTLFNRKNNRVIDFHNAKIINKANSRYVIVTISPSFIGTTNAELNQFMKERHYGEEVVNSHVKNLYYELSARTGGGSNLGAGIIYGDRCYNLGMHCQSSNGNGFEIRNSISCALYLSSISGIRSYLAFVFMSKNCVILGNTFNEGNDGLILKQNRDGDAACNHIVTMNVFNDAGTGGNAVGGGVWREGVLTDEIYVPGHEYVGNCKITNNTFINKNTFQVISASAYAQNWEISGNIYEGNNLAGTLFNLGASGNPNTNEKLAGGHEIHHNSIYNVDSQGNSLLVSRLNCSYYKNKHFNVKSMYMLQARELLGGANLDYVEFDDNEFDENCGIYCNVAGSHGFNATANVDKFRFTGNKGTLKALKRATSVNLTMLNSVAGLTEIHSNELKLKSTTDISTITAFLVGGAKVRGLQNQEITIDATGSALTTATVVNLLNNSPVVESVHADNTYIASGTITTKRPLATTSEVIQGVNTYIGEWSYEVLNNSGKLLKEQSIEFKAAAMPTSGTYKAGDFVRNSDPTIVTNEVILGWLRVTTGSTHVLNTDWVEIRQSIT